MNIPQTDPPWFALVVRSRWEKCTALSLASKGYECLLPVYKDKRRWSDRWRQVEVPLFPTYLFCRFEAGARTPVLSVPGVISIVGAGRTMTPVDRNEIAGVELIARTGVPAEPWPFIEAGQTIRLDQGPLRGLTGIVLQCREKSKLIISVTLLKRAIAVEIDRAWASELTRGAAARQNISILGFGPEPEVLRSRVNPPVSS